jgi:signal transduction histidine kinase
VQIVLQTGYAGEKPPLQMLEELDIQGYHDKIDNPDRLLMLVKSALKAAVHLQQVRQTEQLKSELLTNVTHELRTPLTVLLGYSKLLLANPDRFLPDDIQHGLERMHRQARRLSALVENFLHMAQVQATAMEVECHEVQLADFQDEMYELMDFLLHEKAVAFDWHVSPDLPDIWADPNKLVLILRNLLANAAKFTEAGTISVWTTASGADKTVAVHVQDTGIGITPADHEHVFERFRQVDGGSTRKYQGTGIGMTLSRQLAELMEGTLCVASQLGAGATFTLTLRAAKAQPTPLERVADPELPHAA